MNYKQESIKYQKIQPPESLSGLVEFFWVFEGEFSSNNSYQQPTTATIFPKLSFQYEGMMALVDHSNQKELYIRSGLQAQTNQFQRIIADHKVGVVGVCFFPQAVPLLFKIPANDITNYNLEIADLLGSEGRQLESQIIDADSNERRIQIIIRFLVKKLNRLNTHKSIFSSAIQYLYQSPGKIPMPQLASNYFLSQRQFERKFKEQTGFSPKMFSRIVRFENCISKGFAGLQSLTELAHLAGYYDQSHFIKDFKEFTGKNPREYFSNDLSFFFE